VFFSVTYGESATSKQNYRAVVDGRRRRRQRAVARSRGQGIKGVERLLVSLLSVFEYTIDNS
jgi:hypothetical protein